MDMAVNLIPALGPATETLLWVVILTGLLFLIPLLEAWQDPDVEFDWPPHWD